ncbi:MAG: c-type cytochrome [Pararhodobacter sp.]|nr:c-type cytochrome [Pararhodobacter sp.]
MRPAHFLAASFFLAVATSPAIADANGMMLAQSCAGCHGQDGAGQGAVPDIRGYDREAFMRIWEGFRTDERPATIMNRIAPGFTEAEVAALADYFSSLE